MIQRSLVQVQQMLGESGLAAKWETVQIKGVSIDSRSIQAGNLYIPIRGERFDGHAFVEAAIQNGAAAVLWERDVANPPTHIPVIFVKNTLQALQQLASSYRNELAVKVVGITGSNGKTTAKDMITGLLATTYKVQKTAGNFNNHIGLPLTILRLEEDTEIAVLEMGMSDRGEIEFLSKLARPDAAIITNIGESHLMQLGSRAGIAEAKLEIVLGLQEGGLFVYNGDEPLLTERVARLHLPITVQSFGADNGNDYYPTSIEVTAAGTAFTLNQAGDTSFFLPVLGRHNVYNALACMAVAHAFGVAWEEMQQGLAALEMTGMRLELGKASSGATIINDAYNASPTSMKAALALLSELEGFSRKIVVLGDILELGDEEERFHYEIGQYIDPAHIQYVYTYGRLGAYIAKGAAERLGEDRVKAYDEKTALAHDLRQLIQSEDAILVKASRGMRMEEIIAML